MLVSGSHRFCVYTHSIGGVVFYVGVGEVDRAFSRRSRSKSWRLKVRDGDYSVEIASRHATRLEAVTAEIELIKRLKPECNLMHNGWACPDTTKAALSIQKKGRARTEEHRANMKAGWAKAHAEGKHSDKMTAIECVETGARYRSIRYAASEMGLDQASVRLCVLGKRISTGGYTFRSVQTTSATSATAA